MTETQEKTLDLALLEQHANPVKKNGKEKDNYAELIATVPLETLIKIQEKKKLIEHYLSSIERYLMVKLERGEEVPGYKLVKSRARRTWKKDVEGVGKELIELGVEDPYKKSIIGIGEVERVVGKGKIDS